MNQAHSDTTSRSTLDEIRRRVLDRRAIVAKGDDDLDEALLAAAELMVALWRRARRLRADLEGRTRSASGPVDRLPRSLMKTLAQVAEEETSAAMVQFLWQALEEPPEDARARRHALRASREAGRAQLGEDGKSAFVPNPDYVVTDATHPVIGSSHEADLYPPHDPLLLAAASMLEPWERAAALRDEWNRRAMLDEPMTSEQRFGLIAAIDEAAQDTSDAFAEFMSVLEAGPPDDGEDDESVLSILDAYAHLTRGGGEASPSATVNDAPARPTPSRSKRASCVP